MQASWLLSVDRQRMQDFAENAWNRALLMTLPRLLQVHLRWIAHAKPLNLAKAYDILPDMEASKAGALASKVLNQDMTWDTLQMSIRVENLVPALKPDGQVQFLRAQEVVWVPPSFVEILPADFLTSWLGCAPIAADQIGKAVWHPLWLSLRQIDARMLELRRKQLESALRIQEKPAAMAVKLLAALGLWASPMECANGVPASTPTTVGPRPKGQVQPGALQATTRDAGREAWVPRLPMVQTWPVFWTARQEVVAASSVHWPDESWSQLSPAVRDILEGSLAGERRQALHADLLPLTLGGPAAFGTALPEIEGATEREVRAARGCLQFAKRQMPQTAIAVQDAISRKMQQWQLESVKGLSPSTAQQVVALSHWAMESNNWTVITHALAGDTEPQLLPIAEVHMRSEDLASLEKLSGVKLPYVSALYSAASQDGGKWEAFWQRCGLRSSFSFVASVSELQPFEHAWLPGKQIPARRTSKKDGELPYGLGKLPQTALKVVDVAFTPEWSKVISEIGQAQPPADPAEEEQWRQDAMSLARLVSRLHVEMDNSAVAPADVPAADLPAPKAGGGSKTLPSGKSPPSHRSLYFMPPGQPGEKRLALYPAQWLRQLTTSRWVPAKEVAGAAKRGWFKPCEVLLKADATRPGLPVAELPAEIIRQLEAVKSLFAWGTVAPEPPVERLASLGAAAARKAASEAPEPLWRAVVHAHRGGNLKPAQRSKLKTLGSLPVFPAPVAMLDGADRLTAARLVVPQTGASQEQAEEVKALIEAKWLVDVHSADWPLRDVADDVLALVDIATRPSRACTEAFVSWCCSFEPENPGEELRTALTHALASLAAEATKLKLKPPQAMQKILPNLKLFCKEGPGLGKGRFPARWLPAYGPGPGGVVPVLNDDVTKAAMLTPAQGLQLLGILDHPKSHFPSAARLQAKDEQVIEALGILKLSDPRVKLQTRITGAAEIVPGSEERISVVLKLLWRSANKELPSDHVKVRLRKCETIARELSLGDGEHKACMEAFAMWGEKEEDGETCYDLLVAGDVDDYAAEVEELFEAKFDVIFRCCETRPAKVLRLLRHLESDKDFNKFLARDFAGVLEQQEMERRKAEARASQMAQTARKRAEEQQAKQQAQQQAEKKAALEQQEQAEREQREELEQFLQAATTAKAQAENETMAGIAKAQSTASSLDVPAAKALAAGLQGGAANMAVPVGALQPGAVTARVVPPRVIPPPAQLKQEADASAASLAVPPAASPADVKRGGIYPLPNMAKVGLVVPPRTIQAKAATEATPIAPEADSEKSEERPTKKPKLNEENGNQVTQVNGSDPLATLQEELGKLRRENEALRIRAGHTATQFPILPGSQEQEDDEEGEVKTVATKGEIKRMKLEAKEVLYRPISEGFGYKMLQKMGWKEGEGLGKEEKGLATPLWVDPREGRSGLFSAQSGESRPVRPATELEDYFNPKPLAANPVRFVSEGGETTETKEDSISSDLRGLGFVNAQSAAGGSGKVLPTGAVAPHFRRASEALPRSRPSVAQVAPALFGLLADQRWQSGGASNGAFLLGQLLEEALDPSSAERFLQLVDERLGPQVTAHLAQM